MATERLPMRKVREILRQKLVLRRSHREIAASVGKSAGVIGGTVTRASIAGVDWSAACALTDDELEERLYGPRVCNRVDRPLPDPVQIHLELRRVGVTLELLHLEYLERHPDGYKYTKFCEVYREWAERRAPTMRQVYVAGEKCFVDYSGKKPHIVDPDTGQVIEVELFVGVLGASNFTFARATRTQQVHDFIGAHLLMLERFGGVSKMIVPDYVARHVIVVLCPAPLRGRDSASRARAGRSSLAGAHNGQRLASQASNASSFRQTAFRGSAAEAVAGGSHTASAASFARMLISA